MFLAAFTSALQAKPQAVQAKAAWFWRDFASTRPHGGEVITNAAAGDPLVKALVYVDAFIPDSGQSIGDLLGAVPGSCIAGPASYNGVPYPDAPPNVADVYLRPAKFPGCFASGLPAARAAVLAATQRPLSSKAVTRVNAGHLSLITAADTVTQVIIKAAAATR
jgi:hypothetical protein